jgi:hypothetical protein
MLPLRDLLLGDTAPLRQEELSPSPEVAPTDQILGKRDHTTIISLKI